MASSGRYSVEVEWKHGQRHKRESDAAWTARFTTTQNVVLELNERDKIDDGPGRPGGDLGLETMKRRLTLRFDEFGWQSLEAQAEREGETLDGLLSFAGAYFESELGSTRPILRAPRFKPSGKGTPREVQLELAGDRWESLEAEARNQDKALEEILEHAAFVYLADVESGRAAEAALGRAESEEEKTD
jgi:hypothetical protein